MPRKVNNSLPAILNRLGMKSLVRAYHRGAFHVPKPKFGTVLRNNTPAHPAEMLSERFWLAVAFAPKGAVVGSKAEAKSAARILR